MGGASFVGRVVSNRMQKTVVVAVDYVVWRPKLKMYEKRTAKHFAHDEEQACDIGDTVRIQRIPRRSKHKHYAVEEVLRKVNVYAPALGAAETERAAKDASAFPDRAAYAERQLALAEKRLQQLLQLKAAYDQDTASVLATAGNSSHTSYCSSSSNGSSGSSGSSSSSSSGGNTSQPPTV